MSSLDINSFDQEPNFKASNTGDIPRYFSATRASTIERCQLLELLGLISEEQVPEAHSDQQQLRNLIMRITSILFEVPELRNLIYSDCCEPLEVLESLLRSFNTISDSSSKFKRLRNELVVQLETYPLAPSPPFEEVFDNLQLANKFQDHQLVCVDTNRIVPLEYYSSWPYVFPLIGLVASTKQLLLQALANLGLTSEIEVARTLLQISRSRHRRCYNVDTANFLNAKICKGAPFHNHNMRLASYEQSRLFKVLSRHRSNDEIISASIAAIEAKYQYEIEVWETEEPWVFRPQKLGRPAKNITPMSEPQASEAGTNEGETESPEVEKASPRANNKKVTTPKAPRKNRASINPPRSKKVSKILFPRDGGSESEEDLQDHQKNPTEVPAKKAQKSQRRPLPEIVRFKVWCRLFKMVEECPICDTEMNYVSWEAGHIIPHSKGGVTRLDNLLPICICCNRSMSSSNMKDFVQENFPEKMEVLSVFFDK